MKQLTNLFLLLPIILFSQQLVVEGIVLDDLGDPLPGATIQIQGVDQVGAITNFDGEFSVILDSPDQSIVVSYIGFISETVSVNGQNNLTIKLSQDISELDEVVVTPDNAEKFLDLKEEEFKGFDYTSDKSTKVQNKLTDSRVLSNGIDFVNVTRLILKALSKNKNDDKSNIKPSEILPYVFDDIFFLQDLNLKQDQIVGFLEYIDKKILSDELLKQSQKLQLIDFLIKESEKYIKDLSE